MLTKHPPFPLPPEVTQVILGGGSSIDLDGLRVHTYQEASAFALNYGYDLDVPAQRNHVVRVYEDALAFLQGVILAPSVGATEGSLAQDRAPLQVPVAFQDLQDPLELLVWASERPRTERAKWACALLRVMHTLFHIDHNVNLRLLPEIQRQVFERYDRFLVPRGDGWVLKGAYEVPLVAVERKENKDRTSMLLKLLHKAENVAETIYDQIGIRLVAEDQLGVLMAIRFLLDHHVLMFTNVKPSRSRNYMIDLDALAAWMDEVPQAFQVADLGPAERQALCERIAQKHAGGPGVNPFTSQDYSAVQFTARTLIRIPNPAVNALEALTARLGAMGRGELADLLHIPELIQEQEEFTFFFAHEVQVMERSGFQNAQSGPASHTEYKQRQREAARRRVLKGLLS